MVIRPTNCQVTSVRLDDFLRFRLLFEFLVNTLMDILGFPPLIAARIACKVYANVKNHGNAVFW